MTFSRTLRHAGLRVLAPLAAAAALLTACGGGTSQVQAFVPARLLVVGDETGMLIDDGSQNGFKYSLNERPTATDTAAAAAAKCLLLPTPAQTVAAHYNFRFKECNPPDDAGTRPNAHAQSLGQVDAQADDRPNGLKAQIAAVTDLGASDMVLFTIGTNDVLAVYQQRSIGALTSDAEAVAEARRRGSAVAEQVNLVLGTGARGLVLTAPALGKSPFALAKSEADQALITALTTAFNSAMRLGIDATKYDGRNYGLVLADDVTAAIEKFPSSFLSGVQNVKQAQCDSSVALPTGCVTSTTVLSNTHLWASERFLAPVANAQIGSQVLSRAVNNPF